MKELKDIVAAFKLAQQNGQACALATVVQVEGSSYRRPGARMLVTDDGQLTGAISGGCLEGDALRKALLAISEGRNKLVIYDTTDEDDAKFGVQLGCNGIVHILFEPIDSAVENHLIRLIEEAVSQRRSSVLSTLFSLEDKGNQPGTCALYIDDSTLSTAELHLSSFVDNGSMMAAANAVMIEGCSQITFYDKHGLTGLHQLITPSLSLVIGGAGNDVMPLVSIAGVLGWETTIVDGRRTHLSHQRFPQAKTLVLAKPDTFSEQVPIDHETVCVLMSHNYNYDLGMLRQLLASPARYIAILGPKAKQERMYADLESEGVHVTDRSRIFSPAGLDLGAETAEEIALSIAAEIQCVIKNKNAGMLRQKQRAVHA